MIKIQQLKMQPGHSEEELTSKAAKLLKIKPSEILKLEILKQSVDARKKPEIWFSYSVLVKVANETAVLKRAGNNMITSGTVEDYLFPEKGTDRMKQRPVIIGMGPAGLFCGYFLAMHGYRPILLERGKEVALRVKDVVDFWEHGTLNPNSNVQFGEGGAGTFSDGKLNTLVNDKFGRNKEVLRVFVEHGAPEKIMYENKPHIGTDILMRVVQNIRKKIAKWGGDIRFESEVTDFTIEGGKITGLEINNSEQLPVETVILAIGHSARNTFETLYQRRIPMQAKAFAVGFRVEHPQELINLNQYGKTDLSGLPVASYKLAAKAKDGRGVYSFCMCPGGYVVNASSEAGRLAVNGMSYSGRDSKNANSAIIISITPDDFDGKDPLSGIQFQRDLEEKAFKLGNGAIPVQYYKDFCKRSSDNNHVQEGFLPCIKGRYQFANVDEILPPKLNQAFIEGMNVFQKMIPGFADDYCIVSGVESRTSSPVRIMRNENLESEICGLYPCGEGAGYAGGITSAAMDGICIAEAIAKKYQS